MTKEALKLALEALEHEAKIGNDDAYKLERDAIKEALANEALEKMAENARELGLDYEPVSWKLGSSGIGGTGVTVEPEQEPVAWEQFYPDMGKPKLAYLPPTESPENACYTAPSTWVGLTDDEIDKAWRSCDYTVPWEQHRIDIARAIEAKLKEKNT